MRLIKLRSPAFLPVLAANFYSIYGVLFLHWGVADVFFWFWCEFIFAGATTFVLLLAWRRSVRRLAQPLVQLSPFLFGCSCLLLLFYATLFTALAYKGEWLDYGRLPEFLADKRFGFLILALSYAILLGHTLMKPDRGYGNSNTLSKSFNRKCVMIAGLYMVFLIHGWIREWTTGAHLRLTSGYVQAMGVALLLLKSLAEIGLFDLHSRREATPQRASDTPH